MGGYIILRAAFPKQTLFIDKSIPIFPIKLRQHTTTPVPLAICGPAVPEPDAVEIYSETAAPGGSLGALSKDMLVRKLLDL